MGLRREFKLSDDQLQRVKFATRRGNEQAAWRRVADELGIVWHTILPVRGKGEHYITAERRWGDEH